MVGIKDSKRSISDFRSLISVLADPFEKIVREAIKISVIINVRIRIRDDNPGRDEGLSLTLPAVLVGPSSPFVSGSCHGLSNDSSCMPASFPSASEFHGPSGPGVFWARFSLLDEDGSSEPIDLA